MSATTRPARDDLTGLPTTAEAIDDLEREVDRLSAEALRLADAGDIDAAEILASDAAEIAALAHDARTT